VKRGNFSPLVMAGLDPPARPKPLRRGEGPAIHVSFQEAPKDADARDKRGHDEPGVLAAAMLPQG
jgi:hypothetical protein